MKTSTVMTREIVAVSPSVNASAARLTMSRMGVRHLPVVQGGRLVGILSDRDVLRRDVPTSETCGEVMTTTPRTCGPESSVSQAARLMIKHKIDCLPVVDGANRLLGIVTSTDLLGLLIDRDVAEALPFDFRLRLVESDEALAATA